jgi:hypothetical protein
MVQHSLKTQTPLAKRVNTQPGWLTLPSCAFFRQIIHLIHSYIYYKGNKMGGSCSTYETDEKWVYNVKEENVSRRIQFHVIPFVITDIIMILVQIPFRLEEPVSRFYTCKLGLLFNSEDRGSKFLRNISELLPDYLSVTSISYLCFWRAIFPGMWSRVVLYNLQVFRKILLHLYEAQ